MELVLGWSWDDPGAVLEGPRIAAWRVISTSRRLLIQYNVENPNTMQVEEQKIYKFLQNNGFLLLSGQWAHAPLFMSSAKL